jgi:sterol desaturase/sphingolipid hydroxylase (fatty acid hydroxylase superfamily)
LEDFISQHEIWVRLSAFGGVLLAMGVWEWLAPFRATTVSKPVRWMNNLGLVGLGAVALRVVFPMAAVGVAVFAGERGWGVLPALGWGPLASAVVTIVVLDFVVWLTHVMVHALPILWRVHRVHHADLDYDTTTGLRFHPIEIVFSMIPKFVAIAVLGPSVAAVVAFEVLLNATAMFNHGNVRLPRAIDRIVRLVLVTPDMHRVHHSIHDDETNSNFGFSLPWWDRLFGTYRAQPRDGQRGMTIGIRSFRDPRQVVRLIGMLRMPFGRPPEGYTLDRRTWGEPPKSGGPA